MSSTYSPLKIELIGTGDQSGTWGDTTNTNLGTALEEAITGSADVTFASGTVTLTLTDSNASQTARNLRLNLGGTSGGAQNLIVPAIEKMYIVNNGCADTITIKNSTGTGVAVPAGKTTVVFNNGTNVLDVITYLSSITTPSATITGGSITGITDLAVADGGTGSSSLTANSVMLGNGTSALSGNMVAPGASGNILQSDGTTWQSTTATFCTTGKAIAMALVFGG